MRGRGTSRVNSSKLGDVMNILPWYPLAAGDRRSALVTGVQYLLRAGGSAIVADGTFGPATEERVRRYQWGYGLQQDGVAGQQTWCFVSNPGPLWPLVAVGDTMETNWRVRAVQHLLVHHGSSITVDGIYGPATGEAMRLFQRDLRIGT